MRRLSALVTVGVIGIVVVGLASSPLAGADTAHPGAGTSGPSTHGVSFPKFPAQPKGAAAAALAAIRGASAPPTRGIAHLASTLQADLRSAKTVEVDISGDMAAAAAAVRAAGGQVRAQITGAMTATVPGTKLAAIAATAGVIQVSRPRRPIEQAVTSEGVALSNAGAWQSGGVTGSGVKVGIIDASFGSLPAGIATLKMGCTIPSTDPHGSAVTEIVHEMAPAAQLYLYCVSTPIEEITAEQAIRALGIKIITTSLGWPGDSRGDGNGDCANAGIDASVACAVRDARQHGVLWINSAGNQAQDHWSGSMATNGGSFVDLTGTGEEFDQAFVAPGGPASVVISWDQWPTSNLAVSLVLTPYQCESATSCNFPVALHAPFVIPQSPGTAPTLGADIHNPSSLPEFWTAAIKVPGNLPGIRYDITWGGDVSPSDLATNDPARGAAGSIDPVAASPYAMAVGAVDAVPGTCADSANTVTGLPLEAYSSQGPTIDGRSKPDIVAYDGTASNVYGMPFCGTSASAPHVAGAAALVAQANPGLDASQLEYLLEQRGDHGAPINPASNLLGTGVLTLGAVDGAPAPAGSTYTALSAPVRVLDTRTGTGRGGVTTPIPPNQSISVSIDPGVVPSGATAVSVNVTGVLPAAQVGASYLGVFPGGASWPGTSNVNLSPPLDSVAAASTIVPLGPGGVLQVRSGRVSTDAVLDVTGYFVAGTGGQKYTAMSTPVRLYNGLPHSVLNHGQTVTVHPSVPAGTTAVLINLTAASPKGFGFFNVSPNGSVSSSALNFRAGLDRANMAIVGLNSSGSFVISDGGAGAIPIVDMSGYFSPGGASSFVPLASPVRIMDTRTGNGGRKSPLGAGITADLFVSGLNGVPYAASAVVTGLTVVDHAGTTYLTAHSATGALPFVSTLNATAGRVVPNGAVVGPGADQVAFYNRAGSIDLVSDLFGYFR